MARRGVDYGAGASQAIALQYADLRKALAAEGEARNRQKAREIEDKGLFGTGIRQSDVEGFADVAIRGAEFGEARMERKMDRATKSFDRRQLADERRLAILQKRIDAGQDPEGTDALELKGLQMGMKERRNSFEDYMGKYQEKGLWGTSFGGDDVGYRTEQSKWNKAMAGQKPGSGPGGGSGDESDWSDLGDLGEGRRSGLPPMRDFERSASQPGGPEFRGGTNIKENAPGIMNLGGIEAKDQTYPPMTPHRRFPSYMEQSPKKKDDLGSSVAATSGGIAERGAVESNKFDPNPELGLGESRIPRSGKTPERLPMSGALRNLTPLQRRRGDVLEKRKLIADKEQALGQNELEQKQMIEKMLAERRRNKLTEALRETDWN